jgi:hypothetical protein
MMENTINSSMLVDMDTAIAVKMVWITIGFSNVRGYQRVEKKH